MGYEADILRPAPPALLDVRADREAHDAVAAAIGMPLPDTVQASATAERICMRIGPDRWLLRVSPGEEESLLEAVDGAGAGRPAAATVVSDAYALLRVAGPQAREVLCQVVGIDLDPDRFPPGAATRCGFARIAAVLHHAGEGVYDVYVESTLERYAAGWLESARGPRQAAGREDG